MLFNLHEHLYFWNIRDIDGNGFDGSEFRRMERCVLGNIHDMRCDHVECPICYRHIQHRPKLYADLYKGRYRLRISCFLIRLHCELLFNLHEHLYVRHIRDIDGKCCNGRCIFRLERCVLWYLVDLRHDDVESAKRHSDFHISADIHLVLYQIRHRFWNRRLLLRL